MMLRLHTVPNEQTDDEITILVPLDAIHFIHSAIPGAPKGKPGPKVDCTGVYMRANAQPLFVRETLAEIEAVSTVAVPRA